MLCSIHILMASIHLLPGIITNNPHQLSNDYFKECLLEKGYTAVPLNQGRWSGKYYVIAKYDDKPVTFAIDTAAPYNTLTKPTAIKLGYKPSYSETLQLSGGFEIASYQSVTASLQIAGLDYVHSKFTILDMQAFAIHAKNDGRKTMHEGLLGASFLKYFSAIIDYRTDTLYLLDPTKLAKPLQGEWKRIATSWKGEQYQTQPELRLSIQGGVATFTTGQRNTTYLLQFRPNGPYKRLDLLLQRSGAMPSIYKLEGDTLTIAGQLFDSNLPLADCPTSFTTTPTSRHCVLTFKRVLNTTDRIPLIKD